MALHTYRAGTERAGEVVVFVHGFPFNASMWSAQLEDLPPGWRGVAPDLRGFGRSALDAAGGALPSGQDLDSPVAGPGEPVLTMDRMADDLAELIETEAGGPAVICGLSMGGYVSFALRRRRPDLVRALVLADTRPDADSREGRENRARMADTARRSGPAAIAGAMLPSLLAGRTLEAQPDVVQAVRDMISGTSTETLVAALAGMAAREDSTRDLESIDVPTLVIVGEQDALTPPSIARSMAEQLPRSRLEVLPDAGHVSNLESPRAFTAVLTEFLTDL